MDSRKDNPSIGAFASNCGPNGLHHFYDIGFSDRCAEHSPVMGARHSVDDRRRSEIYHHVPSAAPERGIHGKSQHIVVVQHAAVLVYDGQAVSVGILSESYVATALGNERGKLAETVRTRLGLSRKRLLGIRRYRTQLAAERFTQKAGCHHRAGAVHGIKRYTEPAPPDPLR